MYYTEHTLYLFWGGENRTRSSLMPSIRTFTRSRSPSPPSRSPSPSPEPYSYSRKPRQYISYDSLELLTDFEESLKNWREALQTIRSITDKCYKCGESNHFAKECDLIKKTKSTIKYTDEYENFISKCEGDCEQCNNTRICYQYYDGEDYIYTSCMFCYSGDDWESDMFVELHKQRL